MPNNNNWLEIISHLNLSGLSLELARNTGFDKFENNLLTISVEHSFISLVTERAKQRFKLALSKLLGIDIKLDFKIKSNKEHNTFAKLEQSHKNKQQQNAQQKIKNDPHVKQLVSVFDATITEITSTSEE